MRFPGGYSVGLVEHISIGPEHREQSVTEPGLAG